MRLIAKTSQCRAAPGEEFTEPDNIAQILIDLGHAEKYVEQPATASRASYQTRQLAADRDPAPAPAGTAARSSSRKRRSHSRRADPAPAPAGTAARSSSRKRRSHSRRADPETPMFADAAVIDTDPGGSK